MVDAEDIGSVAMFGSIPLLIIVIVVYLIYSVPEIDKCHENGGKIVRIEGVDQCMDVSALKVIK